MQTRPKPFCAKVSLLYLHIPDHQHPRGSFSHRTTSIPAKKPPSTRSQTTTTATTLPASRVGRSRCDILDTADLHASTGERTESRLSTGARGLGTVAYTSQSALVLFRLAFCSHRTGIFHVRTTSSPDLDVESSDTEFLAASSDVLSCQHSGVGRGFIAVGLDLHAAGDTGDGFAAGKIGDVDEGVVEGGEDASDAEDELTCTLITLSVMFRIGACLLCRGYACGVLFNRAG